MTLVQIAVLAALAVVIGQLRRLRQLTLLAASTLVLFWLQPSEPFPTLGFWLPYGTLALTILSWILTSEVDTQRWKTTWPAVAVIAGIIVLIELSHRSGITLNAAVVTPPPAQVLLSVAAVALLAFLLWRWRTMRRLLGFGLAGLILLAFVLVKIPGLADTAVNWLRDVPIMYGGELTGASFTWLGFSYVAFRLLHTVRDRQAGRLPAVSLSEYITYVLFFPAFTAGPIDRVERFIRDLRSPIGLQNDDWLEAGTRLVVGLFKKFVLADMLAVISVSDLLVEHVRTPVWLWVFLYAYAFRIYLDFSGYTDMAVAMGRLLGVQLPENFNAPYLKTNIALFWNSWHMSLTQWFRSYVFNPLTRWMRLGWPRLPTSVAVLVPQMVTMCLIGLWHGITWGFVLWGLWHALGLYAHNRWVEYARVRWPEPAQSSAARRAGNLLGTVLTFNFVAVGWLFFALSSPGLAWKAILLLLGVA